MLNGACLLFENQVRIGIDLELCHYALLREINTAAAIAKIKIEGNNLHYRTDIGWRDVERELKGVI